MRCPAQDVARAARIAHVLLMVPPELRRKRTQRNACWIPLRTVCADLYRHFGPGTRLYRHPRLRAEHLAVASRRAHRFRQKRCRPDREIAGHVLADVLVFDEELVAKQLARPITRLVEKKRGPVRRTRDDDPRGSQFMLRTRLVLVDNACRDRAAVR